MQTYSSQQLDTQSGIVAKIIYYIANGLCYTKPNDNPSNWKITLPNELIEPIIHWYHPVTGHPGSKRLYEHIRQRYYNRDIRKHIDCFNCNYCQRNKLEGRGYGLLPEREVQSIPFEECAVDLYKLISNICIFEVTARPPL